MTKEISSVNTPSESKAFPLGMHKERFFSGAQEIFDEFQHLITKDETRLRLDLNNYSLITQDGKDGLGIAHIQRKGNRYLYDLSINFYAKNAPVEITHGTDGYGNGIKISLKYGSMNTSGDVFLRDPQIDTQYRNIISDRTEHTRGLSKYVTSEKTIVWESGVNLLAKEDEERGVLSIHDDPSSPGFDFPLRVNIYEELAKVRSEFQKTQK